MAQQPNPARGPESVSVGASGLLLGTAEDAVVMVVGAALLLADVGVVEVGAKL